MVSVSARQAMLVLGAAAALCCLLALSLTSTNSSPEVVLATSAPAKTSKLNDYTVYDQKVIWDPLRPEHPEYYPNKIYLYSGQETNLYGHGQEIGDVKNILRKGHSQTLVKMLPSLRVAAVRAATWDKTAHAIVFPTFEEYPDLHMISKADFKSYASEGNNIVFMGGFGTLAVINEIFGWQLTAVPYQAGPFYKSQRNAHNTVFEGMPSTVSGGRGSIYGVRMGSMPTGARSYYDSLGDSVVWAVRYDLGMVTYVGSDMHETYDNAEWHKLLQAAVAL
mmetsp:Transcript_54936/g.128480  ORF Transcript_54936/g.128480 Transcript_54936/m.128480 type:complete len:278 (+) Transcript_54936:28-861(+)